MSTSENKPTSWIKIITGSTVGVIVAVIVLLSCCCLCCFGLLVFSSSGRSSLPTLVNNTQSTTETTTTTPATSEVVATEKFFIGDVISVNGLLITVNSAADYTSENQFIQPKSGNKFFAVEVTIENVDADASGFANPYNFSLQDPEGFVYDNSWMGKDPSLTSDSIQAGKKQRGFVTFEVPATQSEFVLNYDSSFWSTTDSISIELTNK